MKKENGYYKKINSRYVYIELMRIIAIFFVVFNHTGTDGFFLFSQKNIGSVPFFLYLFITIFSKFAVPLFFMISGALMLKKDEPIKVLWKKRILKMVVILFLISFLYYCFDNIKMDFSKFKFESFITRIMTCSIKDHLWFLYAYIAYLIILPILRKIAKKLNVKSLNYLVIITILLNGIIPIIIYLLGKDSYLKEYVNIIWIISNIVLYPLVGYLLQNKIEEINKKKILKIWVLNILCIAISCYMTYYKANITKTITAIDNQDFLTGFTLVNCICIFVTIKYIFSRIQLHSKIKNIIFSIGSCTFGIYLIHVLIKNSDCMQTLLKILQGTNINLMIAAILWCMCTMLISYIIVFVIKKLFVIVKSHTPYRKIDNL